MNNVPWFALNHRVVLMFVGTALALVGCNRNDSPESSKTGVHARDDGHGHAEHDHEQDTGNGHKSKHAHETGDVHEHDVHHESDGEAANHDESEGDDHIAIPPAVRKNLGITFVKAELRPVRSTIRVPGQFELRPEARREYHTMLPGRITLAVKQYQAVEKGQVLYEFESPEWHQAQSKLAEMFKLCYCCLPELEVARAAKQENEVEAKAIENRVAKLTDANARDAGLELTLIKLKAKQPRLEAEIKAKEADLQSALLAYNVLLNKAESLTGVPVDELDRRIESEDEEALATPFWATVKKIVVRANASGIVNQVGVTHAGWAETGDLVLDTIDPTMLRFHADALQTDIALFEDGQQARIAPPPGGSIPLQDTIDGTIEVGFQAHAEQRTMPLYLVPDRLPRWVKAGVTAYLEVFLKKDDQPVVAIPKAAVVRDGLDMVFFLREADDPDHVVRVEAELGHNDGRWVEILSGLEPGDEVVLAGVYPLVLASSSSGQVTQGGHMHSDGMFHETEDE